MVKKITCYSYLNLELKFEFYNMYLVTPPFFLRWYYNQCTWHGSRKDKTIYLTFDDGPIPEVTPFVLDVLKKYEIKATFFCVGENISKNTSLFDRLKQEGHAIGNHTHNHLKGWNQRDEHYLDNVAKCQLHTNTQLFRPPYGRAKRSQLRELTKHYKIIMWDVLSGDFDLKLSPKKCLDNVLKNTRNGSIIVFHDNIKAIPRLQYALPRAIESLLAQGYTFAKLL